MQDIEKELGKNNKMKKEQKPNKQASLRGKRSRAAGQRFERKVRKDLESKGWIVDKWNNNVDTIVGKLIPAKRKYNPFKKVMAIGTGFPDFIAFQFEKQFCPDFFKGKFPETRNWSCINGKFKNIRNGIKTYEIIGVECKSNGYLDKKEKEKCRWYISQNIFSEIYIAMKGKKRGEIIYKEFE